MAKIKEIFHLVVTMEIGLRIANGPLLLSWFKAKSLFYFEIWRNGSMLCDMARLKASSLKHIEISYYLNEVHIQIWKPMDWMYRSGRKLFRGIHIYLCIKEKIVYSTKKVLSTYIKFVVGNSFFIFLFQLWFLLYEVWNDTFKGLPNQGACTLKCI